MQTRSGTKEVALVLPSKAGNKYGFHSNAILKLHAISREQGLKVKLLPNNNETDRIAIKEFSLSHDSPIIFGINGWELPLHGRPLIEHIKNRAYGRIGDHPFANFMHQRIVRLNRQIILSSPSFDWEEGAKVMNPRAGKFLMRGGWPIDQSMADKPLQLKGFERDIDILVPLDFRDNTPSLKEIVRKSMKIPMQLDWRFLYDDILTNRTTSPLRLFIKHFREATGLDFTRNHLPPPIFFGLLSILSDLDFRVRGDRRAIALKSITNHKHLKIVVLSDHFAGSPDSLNVHYIGKRSYKLYQSLLCRSRMALNVAPTYPDVWPERIPVFLANGCMTITDWHPLVEEKRYQDKDFARTITPIAEFEGKIDANSKELYEYFDAQQAPSGSRLFLEQVLRDFYGRGRDAGHPAPPARIRPNGTVLSGSG